MKKLYDTCENVNQDALCGKGAGSSYLKGTALRHLNIPVAEVVPGKGINLGKGNSYLVIVNVVVNGLNELIELRKNPLILYRKL